MMRGSRAGAALLIAAALCAPWSRGDAGELGLDLELEAVSAYVFRGMVLNPDPALQPALTLSWGRVFLGAWASVNLTDELGPMGEVGELDLTLGSDFELGPLIGTAMIGHYRYATPDEGHTTELVVELSVATPVEPRLTLAYDVDAADGLYARLALGLPLEIGEGLGLDLEAGLAWASAGVNAYSFAVDRSAVADGSASATLQGELGNLSWWTRIAYSWMWDSSLESAARELYGDADRFVGTVGVAWSLAAPPP